MNKQEFLIRLGKGLSGLPREDVDERLKFYGEMIDDRMEDGVPEETAVREIGAVDELVSQIIAEIPCTDQMETNTYEINEEFSNIKLNTDTADILFVPSDGSTCKVICCEQKNRKHSVEAQDDTLAIQVVDDREWSEQIGIDLHSPKVTIYLSKTEYASLDIAGSTGTVEIPKEFRFDSADISLSTGNVKLFASASESIQIKTTTGSITVDTVSAGTLDLSSSTGKIIVSDVTCEGEVKASNTTGTVELANVTCQNLLSNGRSGSITLKSVTATEKYSIKRSMGNVVFESSDAAEIFVKTGPGNVSGSLLTDKVFVTKTATGDVSVPGTASGGKCEITTSTGDIDVRIDNPGK